jgi:hypothetical protein
MAHAPTKPSRVPKAFSRLLGQIIGCMRIVDAHEYSRGVSCRALMQQGPGSDVALPARSTSSVRGRTATFWQCGAPCLQGLHRASLS